MKRHTKKIKKGLYDIETSMFQNVCDYAPSSLFAVFQKLGQLEDIEDELGIDLITLFGENKYAKHLLYNLIHNIPFVFAPKEKGE